MISHRSVSFSKSGLALAAITLALTGSSCLHMQRAHHEHALAVKAEAEGDLASAQAEAVRSQRSEPEFFEGDVAPEMPAPLAETRPSAPSPSHVWVAGHYTRHDGSWVWVAGRYVVPPSAEVVWVPGHWVSHLNGYAWIAGAWR